MIESETVRQVESMDTDRVWDSASSGVYGHRGKRNQKPVVYDIFEMVIVNLYFSHKVFVVVSEFYMATRMYWVNPVLTNKINTVDSHSDDGVAGDIDEAAGVQMQQEGE